MAKMPLQKQNLAIAFAQGSDSKTDPFQLSTGALLYLKNAVMTSPLSLKKRNGYEPVGSALGAGSFITQFQDELVVSANNTLHSLSPSQSDTFVGKGTVRNTAVDVRSIMGSAVQAYELAAAYDPTSGLALYSWAEPISSGFFIIRYLIIDLASGTRVTNITTAYSAVESLYCAPQVLGSNFVLIVVDFNGDMFRVVIPTSAPATAPVVTSLGLNSSPAIASAYTHNNLTYIAYGGAGAKVFAVTLSPSFVLSTPVNSGVDAASGVSTFPDTSNGNMWIIGGSVSAGTQTMKYGILSSTLTSVLGQTTFDSFTSNLGAYYTVGFATGNVGRVYSTVSVSATGVKAVRTATLTSAGSVSGVGLFHNRVRPNSFPILHNGTYYLSLSTIEGNTQSFCALVTADGDLVTTWLSGVAAYAEELIRPWAVGDTLHFACTSYNRVVASEGAISGQRGISSAAVNMQPEQIAVPNQMAKGLSFGGSLLYLYDGLPAVENGFVAFPVITVANSGVSGNVAAGTYSYVCLYEWKDTQGNVHYSTPSVPVSITLSLSRKVTVTYTNLSLTYKKAPTRSDIAIGVYRTTNGGTTYYRVNSFGAPVLNSATATNSTFTDDVSDATLIGNSLLYTTGGEVPNSAPPPPKCIAQFGRRMILVPQEAPQTWFFSKEFVAGYPIEFSDDFIKTIDPRGGDITGVTQMDDKLIFFKSANIFFTVGDGPTLTGSQDNFSNPQLVPTDTGCTEQASLVTSPMGTFYKSSNGIYLLGRGMAVEYVGAPVEAYNGDRITSASLVEGVSQVRFTLDSGVALVYDYYMKQWYVFDNYDAVSNTTYDGTFHHLTPAGQVYRETPGAHTDAGAEVLISLKTAWLSLAGVQGVQRAYHALLLGKYFSPHNLNVKIYRDFQDSEFQELDITTLTDPNGPLQHRINFDIQKCEALQLELQETLPMGATPGEGFSISSLGLLVGAKTGLKRLPAGNVHG